MLGLWDGSEFLPIFAVPSFCLSLLIGCTTSSEVSIPELPPGSPANSHDTAGSRMLAVTSLREDAITRATTSRLDREPPAPPEMSMPMDHGGMKMDHGNMNMGADKMPHSTGTPTAAGSYTCTMHPEIHQSAPGDCPICGMKLVKEKPPTHAH